MVRTSFLTAAFRNGFRAFHHERAAEFAEGASWFGFDCIFAVRIVGTGIEKSETSFSLDHVAFLADRTLDAA